MNKKYKILYLEDDETLAYVTKDNLELNNFEVIHFSSGGEVMEDFIQQQYDICVLDIMVPKIDGFELASAIRKLDNEIPIIFLSAKTLKEDRIKGLKIGADDYLVKLFSIEELVLKIDIFLKRCKKTFTGQQYFKTGQFTFDAYNYELILGDEKTALTVKGQLRLSYFFHKNIGVHIGTYYMRHFNVTEKVDAATGMAAKYQRTNPSSLRTSIVSVLNIQKGMLPVTQNKAK